MISFFLLRGLSREVRHWGAFPDVLRHAAADVAVVPLEIPGAGVLRRQKAPLAIDAYVEQIRQRFQVEGKGETNILLGLSLGGMIAARWLSRFPEDFDGGVIINSSSSLSPPWQRIRPTGALTLLSAMLTGNVERREHKIAALLCNLANADELARQWAEISRNAPISRMTTVRQLLAAACFVLPRDIETPRLVLRSSRDRLVSPNCSAAIAAAWDCELVTHPRAGHDLTSDDAQWCSAEILLWLDRIGLRHGRP